MAQRLEGLRIDEPPGKVHPNRVRLAEQAATLLKAMKERRKADFLPSLNPEDYTSDDPRMAVVILMQTLESLIDSKWPSGMISDAPDDNGTRRTIRTMGLCLLGIPELVMEFPVAEASAAMGIYLDLMHMAIGNPKQATEEKFVPGRRVFAYRFKRKYTFHDAMQETCRCSACVEEGLDTDGNCNILWSFVASIVPNFRAVQVVLVPPEEDEDLQETSPVLTFCALCDKRLPAQHKRCPCRAVAYCDRTCQRKHWRIHKVMCATQGSLERQLKAGHEKAGIMKQW